MSGLGIPDGAVSLTEVLGLHLRLRDGKLVVTTIIPIWCCVSMCCILSELVLKRFLPLLPLKLYVVADESGRLLVGSSEGTAETGRSDSVPANSTPILPAPTELS